MSLIDLDNIIKSEYRTLNDDITRNFYIPLYENSTDYCRAVGFFSSSVLAETVKGIETFIKNKGKIKLVASPRLSDEDTEAIKNGYAMRDEIIKDAIKKKLIEPANLFEKQRLNILANLIKDGYLDIKIAYTSDDTNIGIYHEKLGVFSDEENSVAFSGSMNETATGLRTNYETIDVFCSWREQDAERVKAKKEAFNRIWNKEESSIVIVDFPELKEEIIQKYRLPSVDYKIELANDRNIYEGGGVYCTKSYFPRMPDDIKLHDYQEKAISSWEAHDFRGIFDMATGTGKTITALAASCRLLEHLKYKLAIIIVCPFQHLVEQWVDDIKDFGIQPIIGYSASKQHHFKTYLQDAINSYNSGVRDNFCFICTNGTFSTKKIQEILTQLNKDALLIVDEAHNIGAERIKNSLTETFNYRLALSATIERYGDPIGTKLLFDYFGEKCIEYTLERAIQEHKLTPYFYYPIVVNMENDELAEFYAISKEISGCLMTKRDGTLALNEKGKKLAIKRARMVAGVRQKTEQLKEYMQNFVDNTHILVYCGATKYIDSDNDGEDIRQIDEITRMLGLTLDMKVAKFTSNENRQDRIDRIKEFTDGDLQVLVAIKCLDEGVNIPMIKTAFILASTTNPKEYIQRRGRVLRLYYGKESATIYDFITFPRPLEEVSITNDEAIKYEKSLIRNEISRMKEFSRLALNTYDSDDIIYEAKEAYQIYDEDNNGGQV